MLRYAEDDVIFGKFATPYKLKSHEGNRYTWFRPQQIAPALTPLEEGLTPAGATLGFDMVTADAEQYGNFLLYSDKVATLDELMLTDQGAMLLGKNMALTMDLLHRNNLNTNASTIIYANNRANTAAITTTDVFTTADVKRIRRKLSRNKAPRLSGGAGGSGRYVMVAHPDIEMDALSIAEFLQVAYYQAKENIASGDIPPIFAIQVMFSTTGTIKAASGASSQDVYRSYIFGEEAFGGVDVTDLKASMLYKPFGSGGTSDPLNQRSTQGWKDYCAQAILNGNWLVAYECSATS
jgi:N4-gp56 family major capsid protein